MFVTHSPLEYLFHERLVAGDVGVGVDRTFMALSTLVCHGKGEAFVWPRVRCQWLWPCFLYSWAFAVAGRSCVGCRQPNRSPSPRNCTSWDGYRRLPYFVGGAPKARHFSLLPKRTPWRHCPIMTPLPSFSAQTVHVKAKSAVRIYFVALRSFLGATELVCGLYACSDDVDENALVAKLVC